MVLAESYFEVLVIECFLFAPFRDAILSIHMHPVGSTSPACLRTQASSTHGYLKFAPFGDVAKIQSAEGAQYQ